MNKKGIEELKREYEEVRMSAPQVDALKKTIERAKKDNRNKNRKRLWRMTGTAVAAALLVFIILPNTSANVAYAMAELPFIGNVVKVVTFRDYTYESEQQIAEIDVPKLDVSEADGEYGIATAEAPATLALKDTTDELNEEIEELTEQIIREFEEFVQKESGVKEVMISHETLVTPEPYFTLKLVHYEAAADGAEYVYYYTIDMSTGERVKLADLFNENTDYIGIISAEIIRQMREQMAADENVSYWLDEEMSDWNFKEITDETQFYINENNNIVISFNEGDVAPMYMGVVTFEIPAEVSAEIRK